MRSLILYFALFLFSCSCFKNQVSLKSKIQIKKDKEHEEFIEFKFKKWCKKRRSLEECKDIQTSSFWQNAKIEMILFEKKDWRGYYFKLKNDDVLDVNTMRKILVFFQDD